MWWREVHGDIRDIRGGLGIIVTDMDVSHQRDTVGLIDSISVWDGGKNRFIRIYPIYPINPIHLRHLKKEILSSANLWSEEIAMSTDALRPVDIVGQKINRSAWDLGLTESLPESLTDSFGCMWFYEWGYLREEPRKDDVTRYPWYYETYIKEEFE